MAGKKGQKWSTDRPDPKIQTSVSMKPDVLKKINDIADENRWSVSATIEFICEKWINEK